MKSFLQANLSLPFYYQSNFEDGALYAQHGACRKCQAKDCIEGTKSSNYYECTKGFSCVNFSFMDEPLFLNGLIHYPLNINFAGKKRKQLRPYIVTDGTLNYIANSLRESERCIKTAANASAKDSISFLHDIRTSVGIVLSWCQKAIDSAAGENFERKLEKADSNTKNLFNAINLLLEQLELTDIITNPDAITYGKMYRSEIHRFLYKQAKLFEARALEKGCKIIITGNTDAKILAYNSFQFIPLVLLDNAVKYSSRNREIIVHVKEDSDITFSVSSFGPVVALEDRVRIFDKYVRGRNVQKDNPNGMGMGLYLARLIASAHATSIFYKCNLEVGYGSNEFGITLNKVK